jgi:hypothetical protein
MSRGTGQARVLTRGENSKRKGTTRRGASALISAKALSPFQLINPARMKGQFPCDDRKNKVISEREAGSHKSANLDAIEQLSV